MIARRTFGSPSILAGVLMVARAASVGAQEENCAMCMYAAGQHQFSEYRCSEEDLGCWNCTDTPEGHIGCHAPLADGECGDGHTECGTANLLTPDEEEFLLVAIRADDVPGLVRFLRTRTQVSYNPERGAIQFRDCKGGITGHFPVSARVATAIQELVPTPIPELVPTMDSAPSSLW